MSFYYKTKNQIEVKMRTKLFDSERDFQMIRFCSNLISHMILTRKVAFYRNEYIKKTDPIAIGFFGKSEIMACNKVNVEIQDLIFTINRK